MTATHQEDSSELERTIRYLIAPLYAQFAQNAKAAIEQHFGVDYILIAEANGDLTFKVQA